MPELCKLNKRKLEPSVNEPRVIKQWTINNNLTFTSISEILATMMSIYIIRNDIQFEEHLNLNSILTSAC
jgi:hypothetical protein